MEPVNPTSANQRGFVLIMGMALMVALTIMATLQEKMAGISIGITQDLMDAETSVSEQEQAFAALTDLTGESLVDDLDISVVKCRMIPGQPALINSETVQKDCPRFSCGISNAIYDTSRNRTPYGNQKASGSGRTVV